MSRYYCWVYGVANDDTEGPVCPECFRPWEKHREIPADLCGVWTPCAIARDHGHHCDLAPGHAGEHHAPEHTMGGA